MTPLAQWERIDFLREWPEGYFDHTHVWALPEIDTLLARTGPRFCKVCSVSAPDWARYLQVTQAAVDALHVEAEVQSEADSPWVHWWREHAERTIIEMAPKVSDYSAHDLVWIGQQMSAALGIEVESDEHAVELGIYWYILSKMGRWVGAIREGRRPSPDTVGDIGVYATMALRNREVGGWPNGKRQEPGDGQDRPALSRTAGAAATGGGQADQA